MLVPFTVNMVNDSLLQTMPHTLLLQFANIMNPLLIAPALYSRYCIIKYLDIGFRWQQNWYDEF